MELNFWVLAPTTTYADSSELSYNTTLSSQFINLLYKKGSTYEQPYNRPDEFGKTYEHPYKRTYEHTYKFGSTV